MSSHGSDVTSSPMKMEGSLHAWVLLWRQWETSGVFEHDGNMICSIVWKINPAAAMGDADSK